MNKKQLLEAVELVRATYTQEELDRESMDHFVENGYRLVNKQSPIEHHICEIARHALPSENERFYIRGALAAHHPSRVMRWYYRQWWTHDKQVMVQMILGLVVAALGVAMVGAALGVALLIGILT